jgi:cytochrome c peroxidase
VKTILLLPVLTLPALAEVPFQVAAEEASVRFTPEAGGYVLEVSDPGNHAWMLQSTDNTADTWTNVTTHRVFNGLLRIPVSPDGPRRLFRLNSDAAGSVSSSAANALVLPGTPYNYANPTLPAHLLTPAIVAQDNTRATNPTTNAGAALGRVLFHDNRLSANQTISCSSCHQAEHGFSDPRQFSVGFDGGLTGRNSMGLTNARYYLRENFFWDERAATLEDQVLMPIQNEVEMGMTLDLLVQRIDAEPFYDELFTAAFGTAEVNTTRISRALAQFVRSIVSGASKYDTGVPLGFSNFTALENQGRQIFQGPIGGCATCHGSDNFVPGNAIFNNGLENPYIDKGVGDLTGQPADEGFFKVPSLRNIELTAPYMHDGRFATLEEVVEFYNSGVVNHPNLSPQLRLPPGPPGSPPPPPRRLNLTPQQKTALVAFLKTLTDTSVTSHPKYSDPFRYQAQ